MKTLTANTVNDIFIGANGLLSISTDLAAVQQNCITAMQAIRGEMVYAKDKGVPYFETVWNLYNPSAFEAAARATILGVAGVTNVLEFTMTLDGDKLNYRATIKTIFGVGVING